MLFRVAAAAVCVVSLAGCQQAGPGIGSTGVTAPSSVAVKGVDVPFSGVVVGEAVFDFANTKGCASTFTTVTSAKGQASHMGLVAWDSQHCITAENEILDAELVLTAPNGDRINATYTGGRCTASGVLGEPVNCVGMATFTGGTGRFEGATGTAEWNASIVFEGFADFSWPGRWEWKGTIRY